MESGKIHSLGGGFIGFAALAVLLVLLKHDTLDMPYHWDGLGYVVENARYVYLNGFSLINRESYVHEHAPLFFVILALAWRLSGQTLATSHALIFLFGALAVYYTYRLGERACGRVAGTGAALLLLFNNMFFAQVGLIQLSVPLTAFAAASTYYYVRGRRPWFVLFCSAFLLIKESALLFWFSFAVYSLYTSYRAGVGFRRILSDNLFVFLPVLPLFLWMLYHFVSAGTVVNRFWGLNPGFFWGRFIDLFVYNFVFDVSGSGITSFNFIVSFFIAAYFLFCKKEVFRGGGFALLFLLFFGVHLLFYSLIYPVLPRFFLPMLPFYYVLGGVSVYRLLSGVRRGGLYSVIVYLVITLLFVSGYRGGRTAPGYMLETNTEYLDLIKTHVSAASFIESHYEGRRVITAWPMTYELSRPSSGYVSRALEVCHLNEFFGFYCNVSSGDVVYFSPQSDNPGLVSILGGANYSLTARFVRNGKVAEVYEVG